MLPTSREVVVLWREGTWRCEFQGGIAGQARLVVYYGDEPATAEAILSGRPAVLRADVLRQRVLRGDLRAAS